MRRGLDRITVPGHARARLEIARRPPLAWVTMLFLPRRTPPVSRLIAAGAAGALLMGALAGCGSTGTVAGAPAAPTDGAAPSAKATQRTTPGGQVPANGSKGAGQLPHWPLAPSTDAPGTPGDAASAGSSASSGTGKGTKKGPKKDAPTDAPVSGQPVSDHDVDCSKTRCVALTFDDGPGEDTKAVLKALNARGAKATFFLIGQQVDKYPKLVQAEHRDGMELGNHTWDHLNLARLPQQKVEQEVGRVDARVRQLTGVTPTFVRPPEGALTPQQRRSMHHALAFWGVDTQDWLTRNTATTVKRASAAKPGDIVLMHDIHGSTAKAVPQIVKNLQAKGYTLVTLSTLVGTPHLHVGYGWGQKPARADSSKAAARKGPKPSQSTS